MIINGLATTAMEVFGKKHKIKHIDGPLDFRGRNSDNNFFYKKVDWNSNWPLIKEVEITHNWITEKVSENSK